ncbi:MAG: HAD family phosphatase, partial [Lachnospiraceae bacterium]|nr:HAD family phosphatase [Lachnospiraceae bacterium]
MYKNVRLIALDLDGTLLNDAKELTERTQRALEAASRNGIEVVLSTGRPVTALPQEVAHFPYIKYALTADGARIENLRTGELLFEGLIPKEMVRPIYDIFDDYDVIEEIYIKGQGYISEGDIDHLAEYTTNPAHAVYARRTRKRVKDIHDLLDQDIDK